ncbi:MAG: hypothetical protein Q9204_003627 [Flavoplaca sp. TL-2023a]
MGGKVQKLRIEEADAEEMDTVKLKGGWSKSFAIFYNPLQPAIPHSLQPFAFSNPLQYQQTSSLYQLLEQAAKLSTDGIIIYRPGNVEECGQFIAYRSLFRQAKLDATSIRRINPKHSMVLLHFNEHGANIRWFWATVIAGCLPVITTPRPKDPDQRQKQLLHLQQLLHDPIVLTQANISSEFADIEQLAIHRVEKLEKSTEEDLHGSTTRQDGPFHSQYDVANLRQSSELAVLMLTSGSTGNAKAVYLRHGQILRALDGKSKHHETRKDDVFFNWIGLDHVASLCKTHLHAMSTGSSQIHEQASDLFANLGAFLHLIHRHRISYTFAPNFFLALLMRHIISESVADKLDLSCLRALVSGGEANVVETRAALTGLLSQHGASKDVIRPGFGMTETCAGMIYGLDCPSYDQRNNLEFES